MFNSMMLVISDEPTIIEPVGRTIRSIEGLKMAVLPDLESARSYQSWDRVGLVLIHAREATPSTEIVRLLRMISEARRPVAMLVVADRTDRDQESMLLRLGVAEYFARPMDLARLSFLAEVLTVRARDGARGSQAPSSLPPDSDLTEALLDADGPGDDSLMAQVRRVAPQDATVLLSGETGTGKSRLARRIHEMSGRRAEPFLVVNCGSLTAGQVEAELFGPPSGSGRDRPGKLEAVGRGTLFLDEVDALPLDLQPRLLRVVEDRVVDPPGSGQRVPLRARLIAASNRCLEREVDADRFRSDLFYRLNVIGFRLPSLRERRGVIPSLLASSLAEFAPAGGKQVGGFAPLAFRALEDYDWPGNIRELRNTVERAVAICSGPSIEFDDLPDSVTRRGHAPAPSNLFVPAHFPVPGLAASTTLAAIKRDAELARITEALEKHSNNRLRAASELGISRMTLYKKLYKYGLMQSAHSSREDGN